MAEVVALGRVAVLDGGEGARRVIRAVHELARAGHAGAVVAVFGTADRQARYVRDADDAVHLDGSIDDALKGARATAAWLGEGTPAERLAFAEACSRCGVAHVGPSIETLRRLASPGAVEKLAAELGVPFAPRGIDGEAHAVEVVVARDARGGSRVIGVGEASFTVGPTAVLVEAPSPAVADDRAVRELARKACDALNWVGVASVELVVGRGEPALVGVGATPRSAPAVEAVANVDLARVALLLAAGGVVEAVEAPPRGHAFAARIAARDEAGPSKTRSVVALLRLPHGPGVRADAAVEVGDEAPAGVEGAIATVVATGEDRAEASARIEQALTDADVLLRGAASSKAWIAALCARPEVRAGQAGTGFLAKLSAAGDKLVQPRPDVALLAAALDAYAMELDQERARFLAEARRGRPRVGPSSGRTVELSHAGKRYRLDVRQTRPGQYRVIPTGGTAVDVRAERLGKVERRLAWCGRRHRVLSARDGVRHTVEVDGVPHVLLRHPAGVVASPMPAVVVAIPVQAGQQVAQGEPVARIESMKVEVVVTAPSAGIVREVVAVANTQVDAGSPLVRIEPLGDEVSHTNIEPLSLGTQPKAEGAGPREKYLGALEELERLLLGFDVAPAESKRLSRSWRELSAGVPVNDPAVLRAEDEALRAYADLQSLFSRSYLTLGQGERPPPPLEELWRYLHQPQQRGEGLSSGFLESLRRALHHYAVSLDAPGRALELALLRIQKAHERGNEALGSVLGILERRLAGDGPPLGFSDPSSRDLLDRLAETGLEHSPALGDLAREARYRRFDQPALERVRAEVYAQAELDIASLSSAKDGERDAIVQRLVDCPQPLATLLLSRMAAAPVTLRPRLVEALLRRYYRVRPLQPATALEVDGLPCAWADYERGGKHMRAVACFVTPDALGEGTKRLAKLASEAPADRDLVVELYVWQEGERTPDDDLAKASQAALEAARFPRALPRASIAVAHPERGLGRQASQQHFTFRGGPDTWVEDRRFRGIHFMLVERLQVGRFSKFDLERLPSAEDVYLYRGVAQANPKDERLFAAAEVRDLTPVRDDQGRVVGLPHLERMLHEALAGMRVFQARRAPNQRVEWNRVLLTVTPPLRLSPEEIQGLAERLAPATAGLGLEMVLIDARVPHPKTGELRETLMRIITTGDALTIKWDEPTTRPLEPMAEYQQKVVQLRRRGLTHPFEIVKMLTPPRGASTGIPPGEFQEYDLDEKNELVPVNRPPGKNTANIVVGVLKNYTDRYPEGMARVILLGDPGKEMGSVAEPECRRIYVALELAEKLGVPLEWFEVCAGAKISMTTGTENMDWVSAVLRKLIEFTQAGGEVNVVVCGITVGAQPYWNAEATMLMHTKGILVMTPGASMVLTGKQALEYSGSVSAEDNEGIGGYDRIMGPNGQAQYRAGSVLEGCQILMRHYAHAYVAPGERFPRRAPTTDTATRDVRTFPHGPEGGAGFVTVGDIFSSEKNPDRKKPFEIRRVMAAAIDQDHPPLERWHDMRGGDTGVIWDAHLGGWPVCLIGIQSRPVPRLEFVPADGPAYWSAGTLFPQSSKKIARSINSASGSRPLVVLANLSGFDGSPESMRRLQLEYGAEIGRAVVNFKGPIVFAVVSRYHGGAFVVFAKTLRENIEIVAVQGARASVIGGAPAAAVVFAREVETRAKKDPRAVAAEKEAAANPSARGRLADVMSALRSEKVGEVADEFDKVHSVERALKVGSLDRILAPEDLRPYLIDAVERGMARTLKEEPKS